MVTYHFLLCELLFFPSKRVILHRKTIDAGTYAGAVIILIILFYTVIPMGNNSRIASFLNVTDFMDIRIFGNGCFFFIGFVFGIVGRDF